MFRILACAAFALPVCAHAEDDDAINPDRPNVANSSQVVGRGRVQLETGIQWERQRDDDSHTRTLTTPTLLRFGLDERVELRLETEGHSIAHQTNPATGTRSTQAAYADTAVGFKWHLSDGAGAGDSNKAGGGPSLGLIGELLLPTGSRALRGHGVRPQLSLPAEWELADGWSLDVMPGVGSDSDDSGARYGYGVLAASLGKDLGPRLKGFAEVAAPQIARAAHGGTEGVVDVGLGWLVTRDCQFDAMLVHGLNKRTPDLSLAFGVSIRR